MKPSIYSGKVTNDTILSDLSKKIVILVDKTISRDYKTNAKCDNTDIQCFDLNNYINAETGSEDFNLFTYSNLIGQAYLPILIKDDNIRTTVANIRVTIPDKVTISNNPNIEDYIIKYGCQYIAYMFYNVDDNLENYENFFNQAKSAIVPLSYAITYFVENTK
jgi:hypothetical protein